jgi:uncharacterized protein
MLLGLLSDTHNSVSNLQKALHEFRLAGVQTVFHCGDLTDLETALQLVEFQVICTFGNGDWNANEIRRNLQYFNPQNFGGLIFRGEIDGVKIAATHGHLGDTVDLLAQSGEFAYVFHGHDHRRRDDRVRITRIINPGALGGRKVEARSFAILDLSSGDLRFTILD